MDFNLVQRFLEALFRPGERFCLCLNDASNRQSLTLEEVLTVLSGNQDCPNLLFTPSVHNGAGDIGRAAFTSIRAILLDIDYGTEGHKKGSPFATKEDTISYLLTVPVPPSIAWHTGHGIQVAYLLREPFLFDGEEARGAFEAVSQGLKAMLQADAHQTPEHLFRLPCTLNQKPDVPAVLGTVLWFEPGLLHVFADLDQTVRNLNLPPEPPAPVVTDEDDAGKTANFDQLPVDLQAAITCKHDDRSTALFRVILRMVRDGYSDATIRNAVRFGPDFVQKYKSKLQDEVTKCLGKIRKQAVSGYRKYTAPLKVKVKPQSVALSDCPPLPEAIRDKLTRYEAAIDSKLKPWVYESAQLHEHLFAQHRQGVVEVPCGYGKTTWALCHIATHASASNRYLLVTETVDAIYRHAAMLEKLTDVPVGRVHSFNERQCQNLCGKVHTWQECSRWNPRSPCPTCEANPKCAYYNREAEERKPIVVMTHAGFIKLLETDDELLEGAHVIIDEHLNYFLTLELDKGKLAQADLMLAEKNCDAIPQLFPRSSLCKVQRFQTAFRTNETTFASRNIVFVGERQMRELHPCRNEIRTRLANLRSDPFKQAPEDTAKIQELLLTIMQLLRGAGDTTMAYHETEEAILVKKRTFTLKTERSYKSLWILNASASLAAEAYPDDLPVFRCSDFQKRNIGAGITLHVYAGNPFASKLPAILPVTGALVVYGGLKKHNHALIVTNKEGHGKEDVEATLERNSTVPDSSVIEQEPIPGVQTRHLTRGYLRGTNEAGDCTLGVFSALPLFTTLLDVGLFVALHQRRSFPLVRHLFHAPGQPAMSHGRFNNPVAQEYYALSALDLLYQAIWRTAIRNGHPIDAVIAVPDPEWVTILLQTVLPGACLGTTYRGCQKEVTYPPAMIGNKVVLPAQTVPIDFEEDPGFAGLREVLNAPDGTRFGKSDLGTLFGYKGEEAWKDNKDRILAVLEPFTVESDDKKALIRVRLS